MEYLLEKFIEWKQSYTNELGKEIFHKDLYYQTHFNGNERDSILYDSTDIRVFDDVSDFKVIKKFHCKNQAMLIFEETDEMTNFYYRSSIYLEAKNSQLILVIDTSHEVQKTND